MTLSANEIVRYGNQVLQKPTEPVERVDDKIRGLIEHMYVVMAEARGLGLAANQIGVPKRLFVYDIGEGPKAMVNPTLVKRTGEQVAVEGCLSIPGLQGEVSRSETVVVEGLDEQGEPLRIRADGMLARVFQHEIDHLDGFIFIERADPDTLEFVEVEPAVEEEG